MIIFTFGDRPRVRIRAAVGVPALAECPSGLGWRKRPERSNPYPGLMKLVSLAPTPIFLDPHDLYVVFDGFAIHFDSRVL